jgi:hypothetical protein
MTSPGQQTSQADLLNRLATVIEASRAIRSQVALTICESGEMRLASRQLREDTLRTTAVSAAYRRNLEVRKTQSVLKIADALAEALSSRGYSAFVIVQPQDTATIQ